MCIYIVKWNLLNIIIKVKECLFKISFMSKHTI